MNHNNLFDLISFRGANFCQACVDYKTGSERERIREKAEEANTKLCVALVSLNKDVRSVTN